MIPPLSSLRPGPSALLVVALAALPRSAAAQVELCAEAERYVREVGMQALTEPDTIDDGPSGEPTQTVARRFFQALNSSEWRRTPDPRDSPNEASLRYRRFGADCLFSYYDRTLSLGTEAEFAVMDAVPLGPGEELYHLLVRCVPAAPAEPR